MSSNTLAAFGQYVNRSANVLATTAETALFTAETINDVAETALITLHEGVNATLCSAANATVQEEIALRSEDTVLRREAKRLLIKRAFS